MSASSRDRATEGLEPQVVAVIATHGPEPSSPARALLEVGGEPLVAHAVRAARAASRVHHVVVCTEDMAVAEAAERAGAFVPGLRPAALAGDGASLEPSLSWTLSTLATRFGIGTDVLVTLSPDHPVRSAGLVDRVVGRLIDERRGFSSTWAPLRGRPEEWLVASKSGYRFQLDGALGARVRVGEVSVFRAVDSVTAEWRSGAERGSPPALQGGWIGEVLSAEEAIDVGATPKAADRRTGAPPAPRPVHPSLPITYRHPNVRVVLAPPIGSTATPSTREHWLARAQRFTALLTPAPACVVAVDGPRVGLVALAAQVEGRGLVQRGAVAVLLDTRFPPFESSALSHAIAAVGAGLIEAQVGLAESADAAASLVAVEDGLGRAVATPGRSAATPVLEPAGFVVWRSGRFPFEIVRHRLAASFARRLDDAVPWHPAPEPSRLTPPASGARPGLRLSEEIHP